jgi:hypothetical protein
VPHPQPFQVTSKTFAPQCQPLESLRLFKDFFTQFPSKGTNRRVGIANRWDDRLRQIHSSDIRTADRPELLAFRAKAGGITRHRQSVSAGTPTGSSCRLKSTSPFRPPYLQGAEASSEGLASDGRHF